MAQKKVRLGYVGAGRFSRSRLLPNFQKVPGAELVAVSNSTVESGQRVAQEFGFQRVTGSWQELLNASDIDAVVIGTQAPMHKELTLAALSANKHVLTLNAIAATLDEARVMHQHAQAKPHLVTLVFPSQFYLREDVLMRHLLQEGYVGQVLQIIDDWYTRFLGVGAQFEVARRWFGDHTRLLGYRKEFPSTEVQTQGGRPRAGAAAASTVLAELGSGATMTYLHTPAAQGTGVARFEVYGTKGVLVCYSTTMDGRGIHGQAREGVYGKQGGEPELHAIPVPPRLNEAWADPRGIAVEADFVAAVRGEKAASPAIYRFGDGVKLLEFAEAWRLSLDRGGWVDLPLP